ncbi:hypothetical protein GCK32_009301 [Trichostrongylus colubriformis]|uniref:Hexosyltransferase n=1 Tax=Trichostrongylus colubriformis TaxID=6319 RepID=A0AAN8IU80_TRICO
MLDIDKDPTINQIVFRNVTITYTYLLLPNVSKCNGLYNTRRVGSSSSSSFQNGFVTVYFLLSAPKSDREMEAVLAEQKSYHDLIVTDMEESYENLVYKVKPNQNHFVAVAEEQSISERLAGRSLRTWVIGESESTWRGGECVEFDTRPSKSVGHALSGAPKSTVYPGNVHLQVSAMMSFFLKYCKKADFLMKVDDDVAIHLNRMITHWKKTRHNDNDIYCRLWSGLPPIRDPYSKWYRGFELVLPDFVILSFRYIPYEIWPKKVYPSYCDGPIYLIGRSAIQSIFGIALHCYDPFPLEDVFFTGILASAIGILRIDWQFKIQSVDERTWERRIYCDRLHNPVTFAISSFKTATSLKSAFRELESFTCYNCSVDSFVDNRCRENKT